MFFTFRSFHEFLILILVKNIRILLKAKVKKFKIIKLGVTQWVLLFAASVQSREQFNWNLSDSVMLKFFLEGKKSYPIRTTNLDHENKVANAFSKHIFTSLFPFKKHIVDEDLLYCITLGHDSCINWIWFRLNLKASLSH